MNTHSHPCNTETGLQVIFHGISNLLLNYLVTAISLVFNKCFSFRAKIHRKQVTDVNH